MISKRTAQTKIGKKINIIIDSDLYLLLLNDISKFLYGCSATAVPRNA